MLNRLAFFFSVLSSIIAAEGGPAAVSDTPLKSDNPLSIEILNISRLYLNRKTLNSSLITFRTDAASLFEMRGGLNCSTSRALSESKYHGVTKLGENSSVPIDSADLKDGINNLVLCFNREILLNSSSRNLDYKTKVYEKNLFLIVDNTPPEISGHLSGESESRRTIHIGCSDNYGCDKIYYAFDKENPRDGTAFEGQSLVLNLKEGETLPRTLALSAQDKAGNIAETRIIRLSSESDSPYSHGRVSIVPAYFFRLDSQKDKTPGGAAVILSADFRMHHFLRINQRPWLPGLRLEGTLTTFRSGDNTADITGLYLGPLWLIPLTASKKLSLAFGTTWGAAKSLSIYADNTTVSATALSGNAFAGIEYAWKGLFFTVQARMVYLASGLDAVFASGAGIGIGIRF